LFKFWFLDLLFVWYFLAFVIMALAC
jgi:hypothetical protein